MFEFQDSIFSTRCIMPEVLLHRTTKLFHPINLFVTISEKYEVEAFLLTMHTFTNTEKVLSLLQHR